MRTTEDTVRALYRAFLDGDKQAMLAEMHDDVEVRFLGARTLRGKQETGRFLDVQSDSLHELRFEVLSLLVDGAHAAGIWRESAISANGEPWHNHGVDVFEVCDGLVVRLHEHNDVRAFYDHLPDELRAATPPAGPPHGKPSEHEPSGRDRPVLDASE